MKLLELSGFAVLDDKLYPALTITLRVEKTNGFSTISLSDDENTMLQIPVTDSVKKMLKEVI